MNCFFDYFDKSVIVFSQQVVAFLLHHLQLLLEEVLVFPLQCLQES